MTHNDNLPTHDATRREQSRFAAGAIAQPYIRRGALDDHPLGWAARPMSKEDAEQLTLPGVKDDNAKPRWSLLPWGPMTCVISVLEFGARKYSADNWQRVPEARQRYFDASMRHVLAWWQGERIDPESGKHHLAHAVCCMLFLMWFDSRDAGGQACKK